MFAPPSSAFTSLALALLGLVLTCCGPHDTAPPVKQAAESSIAIKFESPSSDILKVEVNCTGSNRPQMVMLQLIAANDQTFNLQWSDPPSVAGVLLLQPHVVGAPATFILNRSAIKMMIPDHLVITAWLIDELTVHSSGEPTDSKRPAINPGQPIALRAGMLPKPIGVIAGPPSICPGSESIKQLSEHQGAVTLFYCHHVAAMLTAANPPR